MALLIAGVERKGACLCLLGESAVIYWIGRAALAQRRGLVTAHGPVSYSKSKIMYLNIT